MRFVRVCLLCVVLVGLVGACGSPSIGDQTPAGGGEVTTSFGRGDTSVSALVRRPDGKLVAAGSGAVGSGGNIRSAYFALARYTTSGRLDTSFGRGGKVATSLGRFSFAAALVLQPDGKLVVAGVAGRTESNLDFALVRYDASGAPDPSFGHGGKVLTAFGGGLRLNNVAGLVRQPDGKLIVIGDGSRGAFEYFALVRYNRDGSVDSSFGRGGKVTTPINEGDYSASALLLEPGGKLVAAAGSSSASSPSGFLLVRYQPDGSLDKTFGRGGRVNAPGTSGNDIKEALVLQPDGKLIAAGAGSYSALTLVRYTRSGRLDWSFGRRGKVTTRISSGSISYDGALVLSPDGKLVAAGAADITQAGPTGFFVVRYTRNGALDKSFGRQGKVTTVFEGSGGNDVAETLLRQPDGKLVAAGSSAGGSGFEFVLARYNGNGSLDTSFGR
jgi:uncharacterized delta-60 repeat protein